MEGVGTVDEAEAPSGFARKFHRRFDRFCTGIGKEDLFEKRCVPEKPLRQDAGQRRNVHLHQFGKVRRFFGSWMLRSRGSICPR